MSAKNGRKPYKFDTKKREAYLEHLRGGMRRGAAARAVGVTRQNVSVYRKKDDEFADAESQAEMDADEVVEDSLFKSAKGGNLGAQVFWLTNRRPDLWRNRRDHSHSGDMNVSHSGSIQVYIPDNQRDERNRIASVNGNGHHHN